MPATIESVASRVKSAVSQSGMTQAQLADAVGMDPTSLSKALSGKRGLSSLELARIAETLQVPIASLLETPSSRDVRMAARSQPGRDTAVNAAVERAFALAEVDSLLVDLGRSGGKSPLPLTDAIDDARYEQMKPWQQGDYLAKCLRDLLDDEDIEEFASFCEKRLSVDVAVEALPSGLDGLSLARGDYRLILVSSSIPATRQRYTIAHELGHLAAGDHDDELVIDENMYSKKTPEETRANAFAASFLMPEKSLLRHIGAAGVSDATVGRLLARYKVSPMALAYRLHNAGHIDARRRDEIAQTSADTALRASGFADEYQRQIQDFNSRRMPYGLAERVSDAYAAGEVGVTVFSTVTNLDASALSDLEYSQPYDDEVVAG